MKNQPSPKGICDSLDQVAAAGRTATVTHAGGTLQWGSIVFQTGASTLLTATRTLDSRGRTGYMGYSASSTMLQSHTYSYDRDRVTKMVREQGNAADEMAWIYDYDLKGQDTSADKRFSSSGSIGSPPNTNFLAGYQTQYTYDEASKRASTSNSVTVTSSSQGAQTLAAGDYQPSGSTSYAKRITHNSSTYGIYDNVTVAETGQPNDTGVEYIPPASFIPTYDADGNLLTDGRWTYTWDGENRLISQECPYRAMPVVNGQRITYTYDSLSRRTGKKMEIKTSATGSWAWSRAEAYLYDGWNMILTVELNYTGTPVRRTASYVWGQDMASRSTARSSWQQAGGVGGLVMILGNAAGLTAGHPGIPDYAPLMDRMGNVTGLRKLATGQGTALEAIYEYDAFGRELRNSGPASDWNPFRFSTKFTDDETGLVYYGYRHYHSAWGRWINRDPIEESGGLQLNVMVRNAPQRYVDTDGRALFDVGAGPESSCSSAGKQPRSISQSRARKVPGQSLPLPERYYFENANDNYYNYAADIPAILREDRIASPGGIGLYYNSCKDLMAALKEDGAINSIDGCCCPKGFHRVRVWHLGVYDYYIQERLGRVSVPMPPNFHFYREHDDGRWSHKEGQLDPTYVKDPERYLLRTGRGHSFPHEWCGDVCMPDGRRPVEWRMDIPALNPWEIK